MAIEVEDGTGRAAAVAYVSVAAVDTYHAARGRTDWAGLSNSVKEAAIVRATDYIDLRFGPRFRGSRLVKAQALQWPRLNAVDNSSHTLDQSDLVPRQLQKACAEYALIAARTGELAAIPARSTQTLTSSTATAASGASGQVEYLREKVEGVEVETHYSTDGARTRYGASGLVSAFNIPEYPLADSWLMELVRVGGSRDVARG